MATSRALGAVLRRVQITIVCILTLGGFSPALSPALAETFDMPSRKAGLWEIKLYTGSTQTVQQCLDATTDKEMASAFGPMSKEMCSKQDMKKTATGIVIDSVCKIGNMTSVSHAEYTGDFNSAYTMTMTAKNSGGPAVMPPETTTKMEAKWLGACKADQKAGDMIMPGGIKINIKDMKAMKAGAPKQQK